MSCIDSASEVASFAQFLIDNTRGLLGEAAGGGLRSCLTQAELGLSLISLTEVPTVQGGR